MLESEPGWSSSEPLNPAGTIAVTIALIKSCTYPSAFMWVIDSGYRLNTHAYVQGAELSSAVRLTPCKMQSLIKIQYGQAFMHLRTGQKSGYRKKYAFLIFSHVHWVHNCAKCHEQRQKSPVFHLFLVRWQIFSAVVEEKHHANT